MTIRLAREIAAVTAAAGTKVYDVRAYIVVLAVADRALTVGQVAKALDVGQATATSYVLIAEGAGLVVKMTDPDDKRSTLVGVSPRGQRLASRRLPDLLGRIACLPSVPMKASVHDVHHTRRGVQIPSDLYEKIKESTS